MKYVRFLNSVVRKRQIKSRAFLKVNGKSNNWRKKVHWGTDSKS